MFSMNCFSRRSRLTTALLAAACLLTLIITSADALPPLRRRQPPVMDLDSYLPSWTPPNMDFPPTSANAAVKAAASSPTPLTTDEKPASAADLLGQFLGSPSPSRARGTQGASRYVVTMSKNISDADVQAHLSWLRTQLTTAIGDAQTADAIVGRFAGVVSTFKSSSGYTAQIPNWLVELVKGRKEVEHVEPDVYVSHFESRSSVNATNGIPITASGLLATSSDDAKAQTLPPWGLDRISHREPGFEGLFIFPPEGGAGVDIYVLDTGIYSAHPEFQSRAKFGATFSPDGSTDGHGHGTHVAGTCASKTYGVAKKANVIGVKVLDNDGNGLISQVVEGLDWVLGEVMKNTTRRSVINLSLGGAGKSEAINRLVSTLVENGVVLSVAAGNDNVDACTSSPADSELVLTVGASTKLDNRAPFSNYGDCVDIFAPGVNITSTYIPPHATRSLQGTSMSAPHVAGLMATLLSLYPTATPADIYTTITTLATPQIVSDTKGGANRMLFSGLDNKPFDGLIKGKKNVPGMVWDFVKAFAT
ncbi:hypothetical protein PhCBS80983_g00699 [Powellomyces hirtus]|uniref:Peptidase S8/S53 domain-containing protein n=1 Tax=Powellomyces hirtus TaxID=109895 RepID=A0A507EFZ9_9FUNG|nr:hypothetical protein PhCBS80983_g00699 [Powellomyces hirtus]